MARQYRTGRLPLAAFLLATSHQLKGFEVDEHHRYTFLFCDANGEATQAVRSYCEGGMVRAETFYQKLTELKNVMYGKRV